MSNLIEKWNKSHSEIPSDKSVSNYAIEREGEFPRESVICDLGGGTGVDSVYFLRKGHKVILVDISDFALEAANKKAMAEGYDLEIHRATLGQESIPLVDESIDVLYSRLALHYFDSVTTTGIFKEVFRIMKKGAKAFITIKSPDDLKEMDFLRSTAIEKESGVFDDNGDLKSRFTKQQIEQMLDAAGINNFSVRTFVEDMEGRVDKVKSGSKQLILNEIAFVK